MIKGQQRIVELTEITRAAAFVTWLKDGKMLEQLVKDAEIIAGQAGVLAALDGVRGMASTLRDTHTAEPPMDHSQGRRR